MFSLVLLAVALLSSPAFAQQPQQLTPSQLAIQLNTVIGQWAQTIEAQQKQISDLQQERAKLSTEIEKLRKEKPDAK